MGRKNKNSRKIQEKKSFEFFEIKETENSIKINFIDSFTYNEINNKTYLKYYDDLNNLLKEKLNSNITTLSIYSK
jgi:hypothetical protein